MGPRPDEFDLGSQLGRIETRLEQSQERDERIEAMLLRWEDQHRQCRKEMDARLRVCEETRAQTIAIGGGLALLVSLLSQWGKALWGK